jgi:hypothetical protein
MHEDLQQLSYGLVKVRSYGWYDINESRFRSTQFEALRPRTTTTNTRVVTREIDNQGWETNYYGIINNVLEFNFARNKDLKVVLLIVICLITIMEFDKTNSTCTHIHKISLITPHDGISKYLFM